MAIEGKIRLFFIHAAPSPLPIYRFESRGGEKKKKKLPMMI